MGHGEVPPPVPSQSGGPTGLILVFAAVALVGAVGGYALFDPADADFFPRCSMKALTGWECPACGVQRAFHELLHGRFTAALALNPFLFAVLLWVAALAVTRRAASASVRRFYRAISSPGAAYVYITLYFGWWILRNVI